MSRKITDERMNNYAPISKIIENIKNIKNIENIENLKHIESLNPSSSSWLAVVQVGSDDSRAWRAIELAQSNNKAGNVIII